ncbi:isochorismatase family protein [Pseudonocardia sp. H11422]|uniref:isochorismatase family protein n=1 Tax=Pseudonocardia sp. H11422 TaxID=2835866 RepID=UPI001BDD7BCC|nr:isochorismatase family protein [Pseudonocardia sp. H11422]
MSWAETDEVYQIAGLGGRVALGRRPAVLVVDLSNGFTDPASALGSDLGEVVAATATLLDRSRDGDLPVIFTTVAYEANLTDAGIWLRKMPAIAELKLGSPLVEIDARLGRRPGEPVVVKKGASALFGTNLVAMLTALSVDTVLVCGATTSGCVRATVVDLVQNGFRAIVPRECVGDRAAAPHEANLFDIDAKYGDVVLLDELLTDLRSTIAAQTPAPR